MRATIATQEYYGGCQRKLAWFSRQGNHLYFESAQLLWGAHTSYHADGTVWRTNPATLGRARFQGRLIPINQLKGWVQMGTSLIAKTSIPGNPCVRNKDRKPGNKVIEIPVEDFPSQTINLVLEFTDPTSINRLDDVESTPPPGAQLTVIDLDGILAVVTIIGHDEQLLIRPTEDGSNVRHHNARY